VLEVPGTPKVLEDCSAQLFLFLSTSKIGWGSNMSTPASPRWIMPPWIPNYAIAALTVVVAIAADLVFDRLSGAHPSASLFLCAIMFVAWMSGTGPALLATTLTILAFDYFFLEPTHSFALQFKDIPQLALFVVAALFVVSLSETQRQAAASLRRARDEQQMTVGELRKLNETLRIENIERKRAENETRRAERELQVTVDTIPALAARYRADGSIDFVNETWRDYTGLSQESLDGHRWGVAIHPDDLPLVEREWRKHLATGEAFEMEQRLRRADGEYRRHWVRRVPLREETGDVIKWYGVGFDIEDRNRAEDALRRSEADLANAKHELQLTIDTIPTVVASYKADGTPVFANQTWRSYVGPAISLETLFDTIHPDDRQQVELMWRDHLATGEAFQTEQRFRRADGEYRLYFMTRVPLRDDTGKVVRWYGSGYDIEDRKRAETALRRSESQLADAQRELQLTIDSIPGYVATYEPNGSRSFVNQQWQNYTGLSLQEVTGEEGMTSVHFHPDDIDRFENAWCVSLASGQPLVIDVRVRNVDGQYRWHTQRRVPRRNDNGEIAKWYSVGSDIQDQKLAESALRESEAQLAKAERELRVTLDSIPAMAWRARADGFAEYLNKRSLDYTGFSLEQAQGWDWQVALHPNDRPALSDAWREMLKSGKPSEVEARMRRFDGAYRWFLFRSESLRDETGAVVGWYGTNTDIEDRKHAESALQRSEAYSAEAQKLSLTGSLAWDIANDKHFWSDETYQIMGFDRSVNPSIELITHRVHPDDRAHLRREAERARQGARHFDYEQRLLMPDGQIKHLHVRARRVKYVSGDEEIVGALMDITATRKSQEALQAAQAALAHASRVATLGEISATIAHEVNQPLGAIVANGQACLRFLRRETPDLDDVRGAIEWIVKDGNRAGDVIRRVRGLLKKADTYKVSIDVNETINEVIALLQSELNAKAVTLRLELSPSPLSAMADRVQIQQVIINLVVNGVDAMGTITNRPHTLVVRSYNEAGQVVVSVRDAGIGIPDENASRVFEAFFSTKPGGLGMGLSVCRSIMEDHGGRLWSTNNKEGPGTTFQFALPTPRGGTRGAPPKIGYSK